MVAAAAPPPGPPPGPGGEDTLSAVGEETTSEAEVDVGAADDVASAITAADVARASTAAAADIARANTAAAAADDAFTASASGDCGASGDCEWPADVAWPGGAPGEPACAPADRDRDLAAYMAPLRPNSSPFYKDHKEAGLVERTGRGGRDSLSIGYTQGGSGSSKSEEKAEKKKKRERELDEEEARDRQEAALAKAEAYPRPPFSST